MSKTALTISYCGTGFCGWQKQKNGTSVQQTLEDALYKLYDQRVDTVASGRTDSGVHALRQVVSYTAPKSIKNESVISALNSFLPSSVRVVDVTLMPDSFDARKSAKRKTYEYRYLVAQKNPFDDKRVTFLQSRPDVEKMQQATKLIVGKHDFKLFHCTGSSAKTTVREVYDCNVIERDDLIVFSITANGFLYKMVRILAFAVLGVGELKITLDQLKDALEGKQSFNKVPLAPDGLYLVDVKY